MTSIQDRLKLKRVHCDTWTVREQLCLASSVLKSGDQNWMSVSRALKPLVEKESLRPPDWFSQKSCAMQYASLLENTNTPKRKKRESGETTSESIVRRLTQERLTELSQNLVSQKDEYLRLKADVNQLLSGSNTDEMLEKMWRDMEQEEREVELTKRAHMMWLLKRQQQQKQEMSSPVSLPNQTRKIAEETAQEPSVTPTEVPTENDDEKKSNRGGRSPLLTSLLKSPSPTTQTIQSFPSTPGNSVSVTSPTITSLLGSSPKILNAQLAQNVSPQLQQLVSTAIASANASTERPSVGAPTLSMLLEMPTSAQRGPLPNLQTPIVSHAQQQQQQHQQQQQQQQKIPVPVSTSAGVHNNFQQTVQPQPQVHRVAVQNELTNATVVATIPTTLSTATTAANIATAPTNISASENMVQIIDNIDDVIRKDMKDMMVDVMDKDEINEIIGDIEELIKEEITGSPQTLATSSTTTTATPAVIGGVSQQAVSIPIVTAEVKPESRDVDEAVSLSDSPQSEMAIEEIDSSTSNIAEIIGTVAIESQGSKVIVAEMIAETVSNPLEVTKSETSTFDERVALSGELVPKSKTNDAKENNKTISTEEKHLDVEVKPVNGVASNAETEEKDSKPVDEETKETIEETVEEEVAEADEEEDEEIEVIVPNDKESSESVKEQKEPAEDNEGDQQDAVPSAEIVSVSSEVTNDMPSAEDTEKSQDISLILEDDESSQNSEMKKKPVAEEQIIENTVESAESLESFKDGVLIKEEIAEVKEELSVKSQEEETVEETVEIFTEEVKKEEVKDSKENATTSVVHEIEIKKEISTEPIQTIEDTTEVVTVKSEPDVETEVVDAEASSKSDNIENKSKELKTETALEDKPLSSFRSTEEIKKEPKINVKEEEEEKEIKIEVKEEKEETTKKNAEGRQSVKKETESSAVVEESGELDEEESTLSKLSSGRAMKTYSKRQTVAVDSETENESTGEGADYRAWKKAVMLVYNRLATHKYASVFLRPITEDQAPGYHSVIFRPMDLSTVKKNIDNGTIRSTMHFQRDVMLMFQNAIMYNKHDTVIYKMAISMQEECLQHMQILVQVTGEGTFRRETRTAANSSSDASESINIKRKRSHITPSPHDTDNPRSKKRRKSEND